MTVAGQVSPLAGDELEGAKSAFKEKNPGTSLGRDLPPHRLICLRCDPDRARCHAESFWVDFGDFSWYRMETIASARLVGGFGRIKQARVMLPVPGAHWHVQINTSQDSGYLLCSMGADLCRGVCCCEGRPRGRVLRPHRRPHERGSCRQHRGHAAALRRTQSGEGVHQESGQVRSYVLTTPDSCQARPATKTLHAGWASTWTASPRDSRSLAGCHSSAQQRAGRTSRTSLWR